MCDQNCQITTMTGLRIRLLTKTAMQDNEIHKNNDVEQMMKRDVKIVPCVFCT